MPETLKGVLERIIFLNEENHYTIAELRPEAPRKFERLTAGGSDKRTPGSRAKAASENRAASGLITIIGSLPGVQCGETLSLEGTWGRHPQHGDQFQIVSWKSELPASVHGIRRYLGSGLVPGIGKVYANKIVDRFGADTLRVISDEAARLREVPGIGRQRAAAIKRAWDDQRVQREIMIFLQTYGVSANLCKKIVDRYAADSQRVLKQEPYRVAREIEGIGFKTADRIAINLGFANDSPPRLDAGILYALETLAEDGHTAIPEGDLEPYAADLLQADSDRIRARIAALVKEKALVPDGPESDPVVQLPIYSQAEAKIASSLLRVHRTKSGLPPIKVDAAVAWAQERAHIEFSQLQTEGLKRALGSKVSVLTGGPGTGKAQPLNAGVLTPAGFRRIGELQVGDPVISPDGRIVRVAGVYPQGRKPVFRMQFVDGRSCECCGDHLWKVWTRTSVWSPARKKKIRSRGWRVVPLSYIQQRLEKDRAESERMAVPLLTPAIALPDATVPCDPYVLGALIGDGNLRDSVILTNTDRELLDRVAARVEPLGIRLKRVTARGEPTISWRLIGEGRGRANPLRTAMMGFGLNVNSELKFIPAIYFNGSHGQRLELLRGLLDTDGTVDRLGVVSFTTTSSRLASDLQRLAWSLGCIATIGATRRPFFTHRGERRQGRDAYTIFLQHPEPATLFTLSRKVRRTERPRARKRLSRRLRIEAITPVAETECVCIAVDSEDGLYVTDDYIVTHNTTILRALVEILRAKKCRVHLAAPTGRAAQRLAESTGGYAQTIHRLLKIDPAVGGFTINEDHPLPTDFLIVDEASMLDTRLAASLVQAVPRRAHLLLVGDTDQLPSVGAGNVLKDLIASGLAPVTRLSVIYRQEKQSLIVTTAHAVNQGDGHLPPAVDDVAKLAPYLDLQFVTATSAEDCVAKILEICTRFLPAKARHFDPVGDVQVLAPMHKGIAGVQNLNRELQAALNPRKGGMKTIAGELRPGDKLIQLRNNYDKGLFNGDIGTVVSVDPEEGSLVAEFDGERHDFERGDLGDTALAYAITVHKSQGSEYPVVIIPLLKAHFVMLQRNLLYTGITRGRKRVFIVGEPAAWGMAVRNADSRVRRTHLREKIAAGLDA